MLKTTSDTEKRDQLKVLLVNGSPRSDGNTFCALQEIATQLEKHGIATEIVQIGKKAIYSCINCAMCGRLGKCTFDNDPCNMVASKMAESDALIVKGIVTLLIRVLSGHTPQEILDADLYFISRIGLREHLSPTRSNGLLAMVKQMRAYAIAYNH